MHVRKLPVAAGGGRRRASECRPAWPIALRQEASTILSEVALRRYRSFVVAALAALVPQVVAAAEGPFGTLPKSFTGTLPAASGPGIDWQLDLLGDGSFQLRQTYLDREPGNVRDDIGRWVVGSDGRSLLLAGHGEPIAFAIEAPERLRLLDREARPIVSALDYAIEVEDVALLEPELELRGMYRYMADAALFDECLTRRRLPVAFTEDNLALERAYLQLQRTSGLAPGGEVLAELVGRISLLPPMEGDGVLPQLAPVRFIALHHGEDCPEPFVQPDLAGPDWLLVSLAGAPVEVSAEQRRPYLAFHADGLRIAGFGGCNRLLGGFAAYDERLRFSQTASTMMACPEGMDLEAGLFAALQAAERYRILGRHLDLYDGAGARLARFEAGAAEPR
jgi:copper homeostasis protein (lipoprotein)